MWLNQFLYDHSRSLSFDLVQTCRFALSNFATRHAVTFIFKAMLSAHSTSITMLLIGIAVAV